LLGAPDIAGDRRAGKVNPVKSGWGKTAGEIAGEGGRIRMLRGTTMGRKQKNAAKPQSTAKRTVRKARAAVTVPDEQAIEQVEVRLPEADRDTFRRILRELAAHFGSREAARLWLVVKAPEFGTTPLKAIEGGKAALVLARLESLWGPSPTYA
jgi:hypothetical protein